jgi:nitroreductase
VRISETVETRRSVRAFLDQSAEPDLLRAALERALKFLN